VRKAFLASAAFAVIALAAPSPAAGWVVVQKDGARVTFDGRPEVRSGKLVGRLLGPGTLVSIPAARVDDEATRRANEPGAAAPVPAAAKPAPTPRPFETPPLGDRAKLKTSPEEASRLLASSRTGSAAPAASPAPESESAGGKKAAGPEAPTDRQGRDEAWWRERAGAVRGDYEGAAQALAEAEARLEAAERAYLGGSRAERNTFVIRVNEERAAAERAREEHRRASEAWEALQEEARKSGAFPGWLR
jgi:hypothetical protein